MAAPDDTTLLYEAGIDGDPSNNTDPIGGAIVTGTPAVETDVVFTVPTPVSSFQNYYAIRYRRNSASGSLQSATLVNRTGMQPNTLQGPLQAVSTSVLDTGNLIITGQVGAVWKSPQEALTLNGTSAVFSAATYDASATIPGVVRCEYLDSGGAPAVPKGNITLSVAGQTIAIIWADVKDSSGTVIVPGTNFATTEIQLATAHAASNAIAASNRQSSPTVGTASGNINAFAPGTSWPGADAGLALPGGALAAAAYIGYCVRLKVWAGVAPTRNAGKWVPAIGLAGIPTA